MRQLHLRDAPPYWPELNLRQVQFFQHARAFSPHHPANLAQIPNTHRWIRAKARTPIHAAADLEQALSLVRGRPFDDTHGRYAWAVAEAFLRGILDTCHTLAELYLATHRPRAAWHAARKALSLDELHPVATQDLFRALHALGETDQLYRARDHYEKTSARRGLPTDQATLDLAQKLLHPPR